MSPHEQERLSAYLDDELGPDERARVADHLGACPACAARLAELAAVDAAVASGPAEAPEGYFESFPARVRRRLERRTPARALPAWTWAAAAVLLLAIVTPLTLRRPLERTAPVPLPAAAPPAEAPSEAYAREGSAGPLPTPPGPGDPTKKAEAPAQQPRQAPAERATANREPGFVSAPADADERRDPPAAAPAAPAPAALPAPADTLAEERSLASAESAAAQGVPAAPRRSKAASEAKRAASPQAAGAAAPAEVGALARDEPRLAVVSPGEPEPADEAAWRELDARQPRTAGDWRRLREDWRALAARTAEPARADAARLRTIEAGLAAWRASGASADEATFRKDAAAYLARDDAAHKDQVERLLAAARR